MAFRPLAFQFAYSFVERVVGALYAIPEPEPCIHEFVDGGENTFVEKIATPNKDTLLHDFIRNLNYADFDWLTGHFPEESTAELTSFLESAGLEAPEWLVPDSVRQHIRELDRLLFDATEIVTDAAFHLLFADRPLLFQFQKTVAEKVQDLKYDYHADVLKRPGVVKRTKRIPQWLKRAVFHRDKGRCQRCFRDMTGIIATNEDLRLDHMFPLAEGGTNDPTNFQLLCRDCNQEKSASVIFDPQRILTYW